MMRASGKLAANRAHRVDAAHLRHLQVHQRDVRLMLAEQLDRLTSVGGFRDQFHIRLTRDQRGDAFADDGMIVY